MKRLVFAFAALVAANLLAKPAAKDPVAPGFVDWEGVTDANYLQGRHILPNDLRHRVVVYMVVDESKFVGESLLALTPMSTMNIVPYGLGTSWDTTELDHSQIMVISVMNMPRDMDQKTFDARFNPKGLEPTERTRYQAFRLTSVPFYKNVKVVGGPEITADKLPYVALYAPGSTDPFYSKEKFTAKDISAAKKAAAEKRAALPTWVPIYGIAPEEIKYHKTIPSLVAKGKPITALVAPLKGGLKSKNPEISAEAQTIYDALYQYGSDLKFRIVSEIAEAPARAYYDLQLLLKMFPGEKKQLAAIDASIKGNKDICQLGKIFEKLRLWGADDFMCKNAGEAKKIVVELQKYKKTLEVLSASQNTVIQGQAMLYASQIDGLIETIPTKVPAK